jgi:hypothetical protein
VRPNVYGFTATFTIAGRSNLPLKL